MDWMLSKDGMKFKGFEVWNCELVYFIVDSKGAFRFVRSTSKIVEWEKKKRAKRTKNVLQCPMC